MSEGEDRFVMPTKEQVEKHRVVVATLSTSRYTSLFKSFLFFLLAHLDYVGDKLGACHREENCFS